MQHWNYVGKITSLSENVQRPLTVDFLKLSKQLDGFIYPLRKGQDDISPDMLIKVLNRVCSKQERKTCNF